MKHADLSGRERELVEAVRDEVREDLRALGAHVSIELEDRFALLEARLEQLIRERRTVIVRRPTKPGDSRKAVASAGNASPAPSHTPAAAGSLSATEGVAHPTPRRKAP